MDVSFLGFVGPRGVKSIPEALLIDLFFSCSEQAAGCQFFSVPILKSLVSEFIIVTVSKKSGRFVSN